MKSILELCCVSYKDCVNAQIAGADRIELCASMAAGGLTPSLGLFALVKEHVSLPVMVMLRPRGAGFCYNEEELEVMKRDAELFLAHGADGLVFGFLDENRHIQPDHVALFCELAHANGKEAVFHRAIDQCEQIEAEVRKLAELGVDRVLTAGGSGNAIEQQDCLASLMQRLGTMIQIQMCGDIRPGNAAMLMEETRIHQVHSACRMLVQDLSDPVSECLSYANAYDQVDIDQAKELADLVHA